MSDFFDREDDYEIIRKSLTTSHLEMPNFAPEPTPSEPAPEPPASSDEGA